MLIVRLGPDGEFLGAKRFGDAGRQWGLATATGQAGNILVTGDVLGSIDFGDGSVLQSAGGRDIFLANLAPW